MSAFSDQPWAARFSTMGDASEAKFYEAIQGRAHRFGLDRPEGIHVPSLPTRLAAMPDFLCTNAFVECMGLGRKQVLQVKLTKFQVLRFWHNVLPVAIWVWDSHKKRSGLIGLEALDDLIQTPDVVELSYFDDRKLVFCVPADAVFANANIDIEDL